MLSPRAGTIPVSGSGLFRSERPWWRIRVWRTELVLAVLAMPAMIILAALAFVFLREIADKLAPDDGADRRSSAAPRAVLPRKR